MQGRCTPWTRLSLYSRLSSWPRYCRFRRKHLSPRTRASRNRAQGKTVPCGSRTWPDGPRRLSSQDSAQYEITGAAAYTVTDSGNSLLISEEIYLEPASAPYQCLQRAGDLIVRGEIAAHGVKADSQLPHADLLYVLLNHQTSAVVAALRAYAVIQYCGSAVGACGKCGESQFVMSSAFVPALL